MDGTKISRQHSTISIEKHTGIRLQGLTTAYSIFSEIKWIVYTLTIIGLLPFYTIISDFEIEPSHSKHLICTLYATSARTLSILLAIANIYLLFSAASTSTFFIFGSVHNVNIALQLLLCILCFITITWSCAWKSYDFQRIINNLLLIDQQLQTHTSLKAPLRNDCAFYRRYMVFICIFIALTFQHLEFRKNISTSSVFLVLFYLFENTISNCFIIFIAVLCHLLAMRFRYLNQFAKSFTVDELRQRRCHSRQLNPTIFHIILPEERQRSELAENPFTSASSFIYRTHYDLLKIYKQLNDFVGLALMIYFVYIFYAASASIYSIISIAKGKSKNIYIWWHIASLFLHISILALVSRCCSTLTNEVGYVLKDLLASHMKQLCLYHIYRHIKCRQYCLVFMDVTKSAGKL